MGGQPRDRDRDGGAGPGDLHGDERFPPRLRSLRREAQASIQRRLMADRSFLDWPFFDEGHRRLAEHLEGWCKAELRDGHDEEDVDRTCRDLVRRLGTGGWLRYARSEEHTSELQSLMRLSYAVFCVKKKKK